MRQAAVATYESERAGTGVMGKVAGGVLGLSVAIAEAELLRCLARRLVLCFALVLALVWIEVMMDREANLEAGKEGDTRVIEQ
jgi:hypothetical protein